MKTYRILIIFCLYTLFSVKAFAVLPDISKAIETRLHQGTSEEITSFIEKQLALVAQLADEAETLREQTINPPDQEALANTVNVFRGISAQSQRLQSELKRTADLTLKAPQLGAAPYTPADFRSIRSFQQEVEQQLVGDTGDIELLKLYKKKFPSGLYESLADIKIKRLYRANIEDSEITEIPNWLKGYTQEYKYYGVGKANKHFKGEEYQKSLAIKRANREIESKFEE